MQSKKYNIILYSGPGERKGKLSAEISGDVCNGTIYIMENENHFTGIFKDGKWKLSGSLKTGIWDTEYKGYGEFNQDSLNFEILILGSCYELKGEIMKWKSFMSV